MKLPPCKSQLRSHSRTGHCVPTLGSRITVSSLKDVPLGRYPLEFNPDGPKSGQLGAQSYETTFYPQGTSRQYAKTIEVTRTGVHLTAMDVVIGSSVSFRPVAFRVTFPDGTSMSWAEVRVKGDPDRGEPRTVGIGALHPERRCSL